MKINCEMEGIIRTIVKQLSKMHDHTDYIDKRYFRHNTLPQGIRSPALVDGGSTKL
jgi:hypothetical protein